MEKAGLPTLRIRLMFSTLVLATVLACGSDAGVPSKENGSADGGRPAGSEAGWWAFERSGFFLAGGGLTPERISSATGHLWTLEYNGQRTTLQISARNRESNPPPALRSERVGSATVDGYEATLWRHPGIPDDQIPPSVGAQWKDGDLFLSFGGAALSEDDLRDHLRYVRRVTRAEWEAAVAVAEEQQRRIREDTPGVTTGLPPA